MENVALRGGVAEGDAQMGRRLDDAKRMWGELAPKCANLANVERKALANEQQVFQERAEREQALQQQAEIKQEMLRERAECERQALEERTQYEEHVKALVAETHAIRAPRSWKLTRPIRGVGRALRATRVAIVSVTQVIWHKMPLSPAARLRIKSAVLSRAAPLFRGTRIYFGWVEQSQQSQWADPGQQEAPGPCPIDVPQHVGDNLRIPGGVPAQPDVSVIVPVYNKLDCTLACINSIARQMPAVSIEVLVIDDGSTDETETNLSVRDDVRYLRNPENLGSVGSCNRGAEEARGEYLFFLNSDTVVLEGWLDSLVGTITDIPDAGLIGSKLVYPDGRLQEAGGIIWQDGSGWNWGRFADPAAPEFNFLRDVDYCSGAAVLIRTALFRSIGGFDFRYAPAYYEDTDLAFAVRARGLRVLYQPLSQIVHYEGVTAGTDAASGIKAYQVRNRRRFVEKWASALQAHGDAKSGAPRLSADRRPLARMLIIDACTPTPDQDSGSVDMFNYMRMLIDFGYRLTFIPESNLLHFGRYTRALQAMGVECLYHPFIDSVKGVIEARGAEFDVVMLVRGPTGRRHIDAVRAGCPRAKVIFNTVDLHFLRERRRAELETGRAQSNEAKAMQRIERYVMERSDMTIVISEVERDLLAVEAPDIRVRVIPLLREIPGQSGNLGGRASIVFVGGFRHLPNVDAMLWFCAEIWPLIHAQLPGIEFAIIGSNLVPKVQSLEGDGVRVLGFVEDMAPIFACARLSVAPIRYGAGQKGKVVTSLGYGVPCVVTSVAAEGLGLDAEDAGTILANDPNEFAAAVVRLYKDDLLWERLSDGGLALVERKFSISANRGALGDFLQELGLPA